MGKLSKQDIITVKTSFLVGNSCDKWWKQLRALLGKLDLSTYQRIAIYTKLVCLMINDIGKLVYDNESLSYVSDTIRIELEDMIKECNNEFN